MIFVTGGTGLLGSHLLVELSKRKKKIRALKRESSSLIDVKQVFDFYLKDTSHELFSAIEWVNGDINNVATLSELIDGCNEVYHCAGYVSFYRKEFQKLMKINREGTANMVNACLSLNIDKFSYVSSTAAIGRDKKGNNYTEKSKWVTSPENSNYAVSKYSGEMEVWRGSEEGLNVSIVNPCVILGAGNWNDGSLTLFKNVKKGLKFYTEGVNAFVDARDVAYCMTQLMEDNVFNERFLIISENVSFKTLFFQIADALKTKRPTIRVRSWMAGLTWRIETLKSFCFGIKPKITKETTHSAMNVSNYSNQKIVNQLNNTFYSVDDAVKNAVNFNSMNK